ncbi:Hypothetical_protein [Hexamita inflata]|uniref:Hypothetical_protein n=1 Tax=Hexamita inflata TaxID=28002 RepID=A0AA86V565_9EUKA|nr:Hypothetical protein HINF_LOCUS44793 [Hexamita inflata]
MSLLQLFQPQYLSNFIFLHIQELKVFLCNLQLVIHQLSQVANFLIFANLELLFYKQYQIQTLMQNLDFFRLQNPVFVVPLNNLRVLLLHTYCVFVGFAQLFWLQFWKVVLLNIGPFVSIGDRQNMEFQKLLLRPLVINFLQFLVQYISILEFALRTRAVLKLLRYFNPIYS